MDSLFIHSVIFKYQDHKMANQSFSTTSDEQIIELCSQIQNNLHIVSSSPPPSSKINNTSLLLSNNIHLSSTTTFICDAWYGFPKQKRPRQERILAISRQIYNYILWNNSELQKMILQKRKNNKNNIKNNKNHDKIERIYNEMIMNVKATMYIVGEVDDVHSIQERIDQLLLHSSTDEKSNNNYEENDNNSDNGEKNGDDKNTRNKEIMETKCYFLPGVTLEALCNKLSKIQSQEYQHNNMNSSQSQNNNIISLPSFKSDIVYLSPDASLTLNPKEFPPSIVIIGMIVDRKVQNNRSKTRAEKLIFNDIKQSEGKEIENEIIVPNFNFECTRLPLDALNVSDLGSDEALNIDTVLEMVQRWWYNCGNDAIQTPSSRSSSDNMRSKLFVDAAARALLTHRNRHPNRTIHHQSQHAPKEC